MSSIIKHRAHLHQDNIQYTGAKTEHSTHRCRRPRKPVANELKQTI